MDNISILMATYNGEKNILEQMESIKKQTYKPKEVIIQDDGSTDNTCEIIKEFIELNNLKNWILKINKENLGWRKNFISLLNQANGDYVFLSDQDDIWSEKKIEKQILIMENEKKCMVLSHNFNDLVEIDGRESPKRNFEGIEEEDNLYYVPMTKKNYLQLRPGWTFCIRKSFIPKINLFFSYDDFQPHDSAIEYAAMIHDGFYIMQEELGFFRKHSESSFTKEFSSDNDFNWKVKYIKGIVSLMQTYIQHYEVTEKYLVRNIDIDQRVHKLRIVNQWQKNFQHEIYQDFMQKRFFKRMFRIKSIKNPRRYIKDLICIAYLNSKINLELDMQGNIIKK